MLKKAKCKNCGDSHFVNEMYRVDSPSKNYFYICEICNDRMLPYHETNDKIVRKPAKHGITIGIELETSYRDTQSNVLYQYGFIPTEDSTVICEWKSPIFQNIRGLSKMFRSIEKYIEIDSSCGTHINVGTFEPGEMQYIRRFYHSLFVPLSDHMKNFDTETTELFGRYFNRWAYPVDRDSYPTSHTNFINVEAENRLEFRLAYFKNAEQFMKCLKFCIDVTKCIKTNFIKHFNKEGLDNECLLKHRRHKASITANKLVHIFSKYMDIDIAA